MSKYHTSSISLSSKLILDVGNSLGSMSFVIADRYLFLTVYMVLHQKITLRFDTDIPIF